MFTTQASIACSATGAEQVDFGKFWGKPEIKSGKAEILPGGEASGGKAAMLLDFSTEPTDGALGRALLTNSNRKITVSARVKVAGQVKIASLALNLIGGQGGSKPILVANGPGDWQSGNQSVSVPTDVGMIFLNLTFEGQGKVWLADLKIEGALDPAIDGVLNTFAMPIGYAFGSFQEHVKVAGGVAHIVAENGRGGAGYNVAADLSNCGADCPVMVVKRGTQNRASTLKLILQDAGGVKREFSYDLSKASTSEFTPLMPNDGWAVSPAATDEVDRSFDTSMIQSQLLIGDWSGSPLDILIREITLAKPNTELLAQRAAKVAKVNQEIARKQEQSRREEEARARMLREGAEHPADGPELQQVCAVAPNILAVTIQEKRRIPGGQVPYQAQPDDEIRVEKKDHTYLAWEDGRPAMSSARSVWRKDDESGNLKRLGLLVDQGRTITTESRLEGQAITSETLTEPAAYRIGITDEPGKAVQPTDVFRKSKPLDRADNGQAPIRHVVYLKLAEPLQEGTPYTIELHGINTRQPQVTYTHQPHNVRSEAVHVSHVGFRPDDPLKRAYLSVWLGTGGELAYDVQRFELIDAESGQSVYQGDVRLAVPAEQVERMRPEKNHNRTNVYHLDFSDFTTPGTYRVLFPNVGVSYPLRIADDVWLRAFETSMHGLLCHRSGIALGPPVTDYRRPRPFHPADGSKVFRLDRTVLDGESDVVRESLGRLLGTKLDASSLARNDQAWGGYMDAGDWDRRSLHLRVSYLQLELLEMFPTFFEKANLALPTKEANNHLPDLLDEALWNIDFYRRLQDDDGGVGGGVESTAHPRPGETSWQESLLVGVYAPDPVSSYRHAAAAAKAAGLLRRYDKKMADTFAESAQRAWQWADENLDVIDQVRSRGGRVKGTTEETIAEPRALAAVELWRLTGDDTFHAAFLECSAIVGGDPAEQLDATFTYANLPDDVGDTALMQKAREALIVSAEQALEVGCRNGFNTTTRVPQLPMMGFVGYFTTPETIVGPVLTRVHHLTGDAKYLAGAVAATQYTVGANPVNATMTTGLGHDYPRAPLHCDTMRTGDPAPRGITIYGPHDPTKVPDWVKTWVLGKNLVPPAENWPASEFHIDTAGWPEMSEYTVHQSIGPTGYYFAYLAARSGR
ncbi:glycoside hydrolase family 9 protein [Novipirellula artificiosorum]|nr:glycoside hydrolase family 9 protein [Novipirellula artificiosorum]